MADDTDEFIDPSEDDVIHPTPCGHIECSKVSWDGNPWYCPLCKKLVVYWEPGFL